MNRGQHHFSAIQYRGLEGIFRYANVALDGFARLIELQIRTGRDWLAHGAEDARMLIDAKDPQALVALQASVAEANVSRLLEYGRAVYEALTETQAEIKQFVEDQMAELNRNIAATIDGIGESSPAGSDVAVAAMKQAFSAANSAYDSFTRVNKQVAELARANFDAATEAAASTIRMTQRKAG